MSQESIKWDERFLSMAQLISKWSKDPRTKVGAVIVRPDRTVASLGYNGFPRGIEDHNHRLDDPETKNSLVVHAEMNAILHSSESLKGYTIYCWVPTFYSPTCDRCAASIIQAGIVRVVGYRAADDNATAARRASIDIKAAKMYEEVGIKVDLLKP